MMENPIFSEPGVHFLRRKLRDYPEARVMQVSAGTARSMIPHWPQVEAMLKVAGAKLIVC